MVEQNVFGVLVQCVRWIDSREIDYKKHLLVHRLGREGIWCFT